MRATKWALAVLGWVLCAALMGCSKRTTAPQPTEALNTDQPNANQQITSQTILGQVGKSSTVWGLDRADDGSYRFYGRYDDNLGVGSLAGGGSLNWFRSMVYTPRDVWALPAASVIPNGALLVGKASTDADEQSEVGYASLCSSSGALLSQIMLSSDTSDVWINAAVPVTDSTFIAVGGERKGGAEWPLIVLLGIHSPGQIVRDAHAVLRSLISRPFIDVAALHSVGGETKLFVTTNDALGLQRVHGLRVTDATIAPVSVDWSRDVVPTLGARVQLEGIRVTGNEVYVSGYTDDNRKPVAADGGLWYSALMISYTTTGDLRWRTLVGLTQHGERFNNVLVGPGVVYGVGIGAEYIHHSQDEFGYGLVTTFNPATGGVVNNFTVGQDRYAGGFNAAMLIGASIVSGGWTEWETQATPYRAWLVGLDPNVAVPIGAGAAVAANRAWAGVDEARPVENEGRWNGR
jgi:hypothetical protein